MKQATTTQKTAKNTSNARSTTANLQNELQSRSVVSDASTYEGYIYMYKTYEALGSKQRLSIWQLICSTPISGLLPMHKVYGPLQPN
jgi:hypothetical protein